MGRFFAKTVSSLLCLCDTEALDLLEATTALVDYYHTEWYWSCFFLCGNMPQRYTNFPSHPSHQSKFPVYRGFKWVMLSDILYDNEFYPIADEDEGSLIPACKAVLKLPHQ